MPIFHCLSVIFETIMIAFLQGNFVQLTPAKLIVDVGGVGYEVNISLNTYESISGKEKGLLHTYLHLTENSQVLFGFFGQDEKELFMQLISVSGVGASTARMMLSGMRPDEIIRAIVQGDARQGSARPLGRTHKANRREDLADAARGGPDASGGIRVFPCCGVC